jgi:hypothetical protein
LRSPPSGGPATARDSIRRLAWWPSGATAIDRVRRERTLEHKTRLLEADQLVATMTL